MTRWTVTDRFGHEIYLTQERWQHIVVSHPALRDRRADVLGTIRHGRRRQVAHQPEKYRYTHRYADLPGAFNAIVVLVLFRLRQQLDDATTANNYVVTAWPAYIR